MTADRRFGIPDGLGRRMNTWANQLSRDKSYPWVGTGLIDDLKCAARELGAPPFDEMFPLVIQTTKPAPQPTPEPEMEDWEKEFQAPAQPLDFDL